jgi:hypothetical protein
MISKKDDCNYANNRWYGFKIKKRNNRIEIIDMDINTEEKEIQRTRQEQVHPDYY